MLRLIAQYNSSPSTIPLVDELEITGIKIPLCRWVESTGCVTYGKNSTGKFISRKTLLLARALSLSMLILLADNIQSGSASWHDVIVPSKISYSWGPCFTI